LGRCTKGLPERTWGGAVKKLSPCETKMRYAGGGVEAVLGQKEHGQRNTHGKKRGQQETNKEPSKREGARGQIKRSAEKREGISPTDGEGMCQKRRKKNYGDFRKSGNEQVVKGVKKGVLDSKTSGWGERIRGENRASHGSKRLKLSMGGDTGHGKSGESEDRQKYLPYVTITEI